MLADRLLQTLQLEDDARMEAWGREADRRLDAFRGRQNGGHRRPGIGRGDPAAHCMTYRLLAIAEEE